MMWSKLTSPYFISGRALRRALERTLEANCATLPADAQAADVGCGTQGYRALLTRFVATYVGMDIADAVAHGYAPADTRVIGSDGRLPAEDATFDLVLSTQVLEHVAAPRAHLRELCRILQPGGLLLISTHGNFVKHAENDYWRWTDRGFTRQLEHADFSIVSHVPVVTGAANLALHAIQGLPQPPRRKRLRRALSACLVAALNGLGAACDRTGRAESDWWPCMYLFVARKVPIARRVASTASCPDELCASCI